MFTREENDIHNILNSKKNDTNKAMQISLLQRDKKLSKVETKDKPSSDKNASASVNESTKEEEEDESEKEETEEKDIQEHPISQKYYFILQELDYLPTPKLSRCRKILEKIIASKKVDIDQVGNITLFGRSTNIYAPTFLYSLQQPRQKIDKDYEKVLQTLKIGGHLLQNSYAKKIVVSKESKKTQPKPSYLSAASSTKFSSSSYGGKKKQSKEETWRDEDDEYDDDERGEKTSQFKESGESTFFETPRGKWETFDP